MSSLPQGWHGIPVLTKDSMINSMSATSTLPTPIRKKWNSSLSSEAPRSKLPAYKPSAVRLQRSSINNNIHTKSASKPSSASQNDHTITPVKQSPTKELKNEVTKLKKELNTLKTENSILKVKVRRVDDENIQKSKQIEKLRIELKAAQKTENGGSKKSKESELLLLRQKCLRLEGAVKERDLIIKKLNNGMPLKLDDEAFSTQPSIIESGDTVSSKQESSASESKSAGKSASTVRTNLSRASLSSKGEVNKLRDMIHKLEKQNQDLQQQVKDKGEEIKRLKLHLRSRSFIKQNELPASKCASKTGTNLAKFSVIPSNKHQENKKKETPTIKRISSPYISKMSTLQDSTMKKSINSPEIEMKKCVELKKRKNASTLKNMTQFDKPKNQINGKKLPVTKPGSTFVVSEPISQSLLSEENSFNTKVELLRKNVAAKKIQQSWRNHKKEILPKEPDHIEKALNFIVTSLKYHKIRKEKLRFVERQKHFVPKLKEDDESAIIEAIRCTTKKMWEGEVAD